LFHSNKDKIHETDSLPQLKYKIKIIKV